MTGLVLATLRAEQATPRTRLLTVDLGGHDFPFEAGQAVYLGLADRQVRRPYSIASSPTVSRETNALELLVQIDDHTPPDPHLEEAIPGTLLQVEGPFGSFGLPWPVPERRVLFVAGGTGIAPLRSILLELRAEQPSVRPALLYSARSPEEFAFKQELSALAARGALDLQLTVTRTSAGMWEGSRGRVDARLLGSMLPTRETRCLVCGPPAFVRDTVSMLRAAGVSEKRIVWETYK